MTASDLRLLVDANNDGVFANDAAISGATSLGGNIYQFAGVTAITNNVRFTIGTINPVQTPLPVELIYFSAEAFDSHSVHLKWATATERNSAFFDVERSLDGKNWEKVVSVEAAGWSSQKIEYEAMDAHPYQNTSYYRLKKADLDGSITFSPNRAVGMKSNPKEVIVFPNPTWSIISIQGVNIVPEEMKLFNSLGMEIGILSFCRQVSTDKVDLDMHEFESGIYFLRVKEGLLKIIKY